MTQQVQNDIKEKSRTVCHVYFCAQHTEKRVLCYSTQTTDKTHKTSNTIVVYCQKSLGIHFEAEEKQLGPNKQPKSKSFKLSFLPLLSILLPVEHITRVYIKPHRETGSEGGRESWRVTENTA